MEGPIENPMEGPIQNTNDLSAQTHTRQGELGEGIHDDSNPTTELDKNETSVLQRAVSYLKKSVSHNEETQINDDTQLLGPEDPTKGEKTFVSEEVTQQS